MEWINKEKKTYFQMFDFPTTSEQGGTEVAIWAKPKTVVIVVFLPTLPPHSANLLCYVCHRPI